MHCKSTHDVILAYSLPRFINPKVGAVGTPWIEEVLRAASSEPPITRVVSIRSSHSPLSYYLTTTIVDLETLPEHWLTQYGHAL